MLPFVLHWTLRSSSDQTGLGRKQLRAEKQSEWPPGADRCPAPPGLAPGPLPPAWPAAERAWRTRDTSPRPGVAAEAPPALSAPSQEDSLVLSLGLPRGRGLRGALGWEVGSLERGGGGRGLTHLVLAASGLDFRSLSSSPVGTAVGQCVPWAAWTFLPDLRLAEGHQGAQTWSLTACAGCPLGSAPAPQGKQAGATHPLPTRIACPQHSRPRWALGPQMWALPPGTSSWGWDRRDGHSRVANRFPSSSAGPRGRAGPEMGHLGPRAGAGGLLGGCPSQRPPSLRPPLPGPHSPLPTSRRLVPLARAGSPRHFPEPSALIYALLWGGVGGCFL